MKPNVIYELYQKTEFILQLNIELSNWYFYFSLLTLESFAPPKNLNRDSGCNWIFACWDKPSNASLSRPSSTVATAAAAPATPGSARSTTGARRRPRRTWASSTRPTWSPTPPSCSPAVSWPRGSTYVGSCPWGWSCRASSPTSSAWPTRQGCTTSGTLSLFRWEREFSRGDWHFCLATTIVTLFQVVSWVTRAGQLEIAVMQCRSKVTSSPIWPQK